MSVVINQIELKNWFNYNGDYIDNLIRFNVGLNIVVGDNNSGKTKLHNAFRWILKNEVIIIEGDDANETEIKGEYLKKVVNSSVFRNTRHKDQITFGVKINFTKTKRDESITYLITKEFICRNNFQNKSRNICE